MVRALIAKMDSEQGLVFLIGFMMIAPGLVEWVCGG